METKFIAANFKTREILYTKGVVNEMDTVHVMVNHWPSKRGNEESSDIKRRYVSLLASRTVDSILNVNPNANIILMGDFNDTPDSPALQNLGQLTNLSGWAKGSEGTYKYRESWSIIDQFMVSDNLLEKKAFNAKSGFSPQWIYVQRQMDIFAPVELLSTDDTHLGIKPKRTYSGPRYLGGVSDHLPIILKIFK